MTFDEWIKDKEFTQYVENGELYALQKLCFEAGQKNCACVHTDNSAVIERLREQIAKMKCCENCKSNTEDSCETTEDYCIDKSAWEMKE